MKKFLVVALLLGLVACAKVDNAPSAPTPPPEYQGHRLIEHDTYAVDDSARGVTCYLSTRSYDAISCVKTFEADTTRH